MRSNSFSYTFSCLSYLFGHQFCCLTSLLNILCQSCEASWRTKCAPDSSFVIQPEDGWVIDTVLRLVSLWKTFQPYHHLCVVAPLIRSLGTCFIIASGIIRLILSLNQPRHTIKILQGIILTSRRFYDWFCQRRITSFSSYSFVIIRLSLSILRFVKWICILSAFFLESLAVCFICKVNFPVSFPCFPFCSLCLLCLLFFPFCA